MVEMKESGITWCGDIPAHWQIMANKYIMLKKKEICPIYKGQDILSLTMNGVIVRNLEAGGKMPTSFDGYQKIYPNNLLMCLFDYDVTPRCIGLIKNEGLTSPAYSQFIMKNENSSRYYYYYYLMIDNTKELLHLAKNLRHSFTEDQLGAIKTPVPPLDEQNRIAEFLDDRCAEIDAISSEIQEQINTLEEYKKSVITEAVTKGLNPNAEMKDSGIEWIGDIPKNWEVKRTKYASKSFSKGNGITKEDVDLDGDIKCIRYGEIYSKYDIKCRSCVSATNLSKINSPKYISNGDILFAGTGELIEEIGKNIVYTGDEPCLAGGDIIILKHNQNPIFLNYALCSQYAQTQKSYGKAKLKVVHISAFEIGNVKIALPPIEEQNKIANYLDNKCSEIDGAIEDKQKQLETLEDYKKTLIYEYVTGKKEVA